MKRKLGKKNNILFLFMTFLFIGIIGIFACFINFSMSHSENSYEVASGSILMDYKRNYIELNENATIKKGIDRNYYLLYKDEEKKSVKQKIGTSTVSYKAGDYKLYLYGTAYMVSANGQVDKVDSQTEIIKSSSPYFFKISDRKYLFVDKKISTNDGSIKTTDYLIIELDKNGNATFLNFENNVKTIKPLILKGTKYDFDIANEKLIISKGNEIDLKNIIGSTNQYSKEKDNQKKKTDNDKKQSDYYNDYLSTIKNSFNNLVNGVNGMSDKVQGELNKEDAYLDLTRWTTLKSVDSSVNTITINYSVFDPNNEYSEIFVYLIYNGETKKYQLGKYDEKYVIHDLIPDTEYTIKYGYRVIQAVGDATIDIIDDNMKIQTKDLNYQVIIDKISKNKVYYSIKFNNNYIPDSASITFYLNDIQIGNKVITKDDVNKNGILSGSFNYEVSEGTYILKLHNITYDNHLISDIAYAKFIN